MNSITLPGQAAGHADVNQGSLLPARGTALGVLALGTASSIAFALIAVLMKTSNTTGRDLSFHHTGDYLYTVIGIPIALASIVLLVAVRALQPSARRRLSFAGTALNAAALAVLIVMLAYSTATGAEARWGGTYIIATLATFLAHILFSAASWRTGLIPKPLLTAWPLVWLIGAFAAQGATPLLLAAYYVALGVVIARRT